jgi:hypothetical protein
VNAALVAPAATVVEAGKVTAELLLARVTARPPLGESVFSVTVQASVPAPVIELLLQFKAVSTAMPVPLSPITVVLPVEELLVMVSCPEAAPAVVGSNCAVKIAVWAGDRVSGNVTPEMLKPVPVTVAALIVMAAVPEEVKVTVCVAGVLTATLPKARLDALRLRVDTAAFSCRAKLSEMLPAVAVNVAVWAEVTAETVAVNDALDDPAATVTEAGWVTAESLLARLTANPPLGAAAESATVHASVPAPVMDPLLQEMAESAAEPCDADGVRKATICMTHGPDELRGAVVL